MKFRTLVATSPFFTLLLLVFIRFSYNAQASTVPITPLRDTTDGIHTGMVDETRSEITSEEGKIDYVWSAKRPQAGHQPHKTFYQKFDRAGGDPGNNSFPHYYSKDWFLQNHPDWLVYLCDKHSLAYEYHDPQVPLDITNAQVRQFMLNNWIYPAFSYGYDGIAFDNVNLDNKQSAGRCGVWTKDNQGIRVWKYLYGDAQSIHGQKYINSILLWARFMYSTIKAYKPAASISMNFDPNVSGDQFGSLAFNEQLNSYTDLMLDEGGFTNGHLGYTVDRYWKLEAGFANDLAAQGKAQLLIFAFDYKHLTLAQKEWALGNYLLVKGAHTYIYIASGINNGIEYGHMNLIPEYGIQIGHATNTMYQSQGVYMRDYSNGKTMVNPSSKQSYTISLNGHYYDIKGNLMNTSSITLAPHSALVLLNHATPGTKSGLSGSSSPTNPSSGSSGSSSSATGANNGSSGSSNSSTDSNSGSSGSTDGSSGYNDGSSDFGSGSSGYNDGSSDFGNGSSGYNDGSSGYGNGWPGSGSGW